MKAGNGSDNKMRKVKSSLEFKTNTLLTTLILIIVLVLLNYLFQKYFTRLDLTEDKIYTISEVSKKMLNELDDYVTINIYFSEKLPPSILTVKDEVEDLLKEYQAYSKNKIKVSFIDPTKDEKVKQKVVRLGIPEVQMNIFEKDERKVIQGFLGIGIFYEDKKTIIPVVQNTRNLEYELTTSIKKVTTEEMKIVGFLTGHQEKDIYAEYESMRKELEKNLKVEIVDIEKGKSKIPENIDLLVIAGPQDKFTDREKYEIDQYLMSGRRIIFLVDAVKLDEGLRATNLDVNLDDMLRNYGVVLNKNLVLDYQLHDQAAFRTGFVQYIQPYPYFVKAVKLPGYSSFNSVNPISSKIESMVFQWLSSIDTMVVSDKKYWKKYTVLVNSSTKTGEEKGHFNLSPQMLKRPAGKLKKHNLVLLVEGKFKSFFAEKIVPKVDASDTELKDWKDTRTDTGTAKESDTNYIMLIGDSDFCSEDSIRRNRNNLNFMLNSIEWFLLGEDLISIRLRGIKNREIKKLEEKQKTLIKFVNILVVPILIVIFGIIRFLIRRRRRLAFLGS